MKIHKQTIAGGLEWKPCCHCGRRFVVGEIITALSDDEGNSCQYWYCSECFDLYWFSPLPVPITPDYDICLAVMKNGKVQMCPKGMTPAEYMIRDKCQLPGISSCYRYTHDSLIKEFEI